MYSTQFNIIGLLMEVLAASSLKIDGRFLWGWGHTDKSGQFWIKSISLRTGNRITKPNIQQIRTNLWDECLRIGRIIRELST